MIFSQACKWLNNCKIMYILSVVVLVGSCKTCPIGSKSKMTLYLVNVVCSTVLTKKLGLNLILWCWVYHHSLNCTKFLEKFSAQIHSSCTDRMSSNPTCTVQYRVWNCRLYWLCWWKFCSCLLWFGWEKNRMYSLKI